MEYARQSKFQSDTKRTYSTLDLNRRWPSVTTSQNEPDTLRDLKNPQLQLLLEYVAVAEHPDCTIAVGVLGLWSYLNQAILKILPGDMILIKKINKILNMFEPCRQKIEQADNEIFIAD